MREEVMREGKERSSLSEYLQKQAFRFACPTCVCRYRGWKGQHTHTHTHTHTREAREFQS